MSKNIVVLSGSPRKDGNTDKLADALVKSAKSEGAKVELFRVADMNISGCKGCGYCRSSGGVCVQKDDMPQILETLKSADAVVFASPVYYFGMTAQLKLAIDRFYAQQKEGFPIKRAALLMTCGNSMPDVAEGAVATYKNILAYQKWENAGIIIAAGLHSADEIDGRPELMEAQKLGKELFL